MFRLLRKTPLKKNKAIKEKNKKPKTDNKVKNLVKANKQSLVRAERHVTKLANRVRNILATKTEKDTVPPFKPTRPKPQQIFFPRYPITVPPLEHPSRKSSSHKKSILRKEVEARSQKKKKVRFEEKAPRIKILPPEGEETSSSSASTVDPPSTDSSMSLSKEASSDSSSIEKMPQDDELIQKSSKSSIKNKKMSPLKKKVHSLLPSTG